MTSPDACDALFAVDRVTASHRAGSRAMVARRQRARWWSARRARDRAAHPSEHDRPPIALRVVTHAGANAGAIAGAQLYDTGGPIGRASQTVIVRAAQRC